MDRQKLRPSPLHLPGGVVPHGVMQEHPVEMKMVQPLNDTQFVALLAAHVYGAGVLKSPKESVDTAFEITAWAILGFQENRLAAAVKKIVDSIPKPESDVPTG